MVTPGWLSQLLVEARLSTSGGRSVAASPPVTHPAAAAGARLVAHSETHGQSLHVLHADRTTLGRDFASDIRLAGIHISRQHAEIIWDGTGYLLQNWRSKNGLRLNGQRLTHPQYLQDGDVVTFPGQRGLSLRFEANAVTATVTPEEESST